MITVVSWEREVTFLMLFKNNFHLSVLLESLFTSMFSLVSSLFLNV
jgi:hypothetical protein